MAMPRTPIHRLQERDDAEEESEVVDATLLPPG